MHKQYYESELRKIVVVVITTTTTTTTVVVVVVVVVIVIVIVIIIIVIIIIIIIIIIIMQSRTSSLKLRECHPWFLATFKMDAVCCCQTLIHFTRLHDVTSTKTEISMVTAVRTSDMADFFVVP